MDIIIFQSIMDGWKRKLIVKDKVNGYKHTENKGIHFFSRGEITFIIDTSIENATIEKFNYSKYQYEDISYNEARKFVTVSKLRKIQE